MDKKDAERLIEKYVDGSLAPEVAREFEQCMAEHQSLRDEVEDARLVSTELSRLKEESPGEGYWRSYWTRLSRHLFRQRGPALAGWRLKLAFGFSLTCIIFLAIVSLSYRSELIQLREKVAAQETKRPQNGLERYFQRPDFIRNDMVIFDSLGSTYPGQMEWLVRSNGQIFIGLADKPFDKDTDRNSILGIESVVLRTDTQGKSEILLSPRIAAIDGATAVVELPVKQGNPVAIIRTALKLDNGMVNGSVGFDYATETNGSISASTEDVSLKPGEPAEVLSVDLEGAKYALLIRASLLREN